MRDKAVNHLLCDELLTPTIQPYLVYDNGASQKDKGVSFYRNRLETHLHKYYREHGNNNGYILLMDFNDYYRSISHEKCLQKLKKYLQKITNDERQLAIWILKDLIDIFNNDNKDNRGIDIRKSTFTKYTV